MFSQTASTATSVTANHCCHSSLDSLSWQKPRIREYRAALCWRWYIPSQSEYYFVPARQTNCSEQSLDISVVWQTPTVAKANRLPLLHLPSWSRTENTSQFFCFQTRAEQQSHIHCKILPAEGNYEKLEGYARKNCTKLQDEPIKLNFDGAWLRLQQQPRCWASGEHFSAAGNSCLEDE